MYIWCYFFCRIPLWIITGTAVVIFYSTNIVCAVIAKQNEPAGQSPPFFVILARVIVNDLLFLGCGIALFMFLYTLTKLSTAAMVLEAKVSKFFICSFLLKYCQYLIVLAYFSEFLNLIHKQWSKCLKKVTFPYLLILNISYFPLLPPIKCNFSCLLL